MKKQPPNLYSKLLLPVPVVEEATYLGSIISRRGTDDADVNKRIVKASQCFGAQRKGIFCNGDLSMQTKTNIFLMTVVSVLVFGCENWIITAAIERSLATERSGLVVTLLGGEQW